MSEKSNKFAEDLDRLFREGVKLLEAMESRSNSTKETSANQPVLEESERLPSFIIEYQSWYSEALILVKQVLPQRLDDFSNYYKYPRERKEINYGNYRIEDYLQSLIIRQGNRVIVSTSSAIKKFGQQLAIILATKKVLNSHLINIEGILQADLFDSEIESANALKKAGHFRASGTICGVLIEKHLGQVVKRHELRLSKQNPTIYDLNNFLKEHKVISLEQFQKNQWLASLRNICCHNKDKEPSQENIEDLISGTIKVLKTIF